MTATRTTALFLVAFTLSACTASRPVAMTQEQMDSFIEAASDGYQGGAGVARFQFNGVAMACVSDTTHNRMRLIAPIVSRDALEAKQLEFMLIANYHSSLDARYAVSDGVVYAAFLHPLSTLSEFELASALAQVATLAQTFGTTYTSGQLFFGTVEGQGL